MLKSNCPISGLLYCVHDAHNDESALYSLADVPQSPQGIPAAFLGDRGLRYRRVSTIDMVPFEKKSSLMTKSS